MNWSNLYSSILRDTWMIEPSVLSSYLPIISNIIEGKSAELFHVDYESSGRKPTSVNKQFSYYLSAIDTNGNIVKRLDSFDQAPEGSIALLSVSGAITQADQFCGPMGSRTMADIIAHANKSEKIHGIMYVINSGGGQTAGMEPLTKVMASVSKPTVAFIDSMAASAAYWIASQANLIVMNGNTAEVGSIGTMLAFTDIQPALEKIGVKFHLINATDSFDKNKEFISIQKGDYSITTKKLDFLNQIFHDGVKSGRGEKLKQKQNLEPLTGKMYFTQEAIKNGLADEQGDFNYAFNRLMDLIDQQTNYTA